MTLATRSTATWTRLLVAVPVAVLLLTVAVVVVLAPGSATAQTAGDLGILVCSALATVGCLRATRRGGPSRRGWTGVCVAAALWTAGMAVFAYYGLTRDHIYPFPSAADVGFLGYAGPLAAGLLLFPRAARQSLEGWRTLLDAIVVASAVLFVSWATVLGPLADAAGTGLAAAVSLAYPVADVVVASLVLVLGARAAAGTRRMWLLLGGGLLVLTLTDSLYVSLLSSGRTGLTGTALSLGWMVAFLLVGAATLPVASSNAPPRHFTLPQELLPLAPLGAVLLVASWERLDATDPVLLGTGVLLLLSLGVQQVVAATEKVRLANSLDAEVQRRSAALAQVEDRFGSLVQSTDEAIISLALDGTVTSWNPAAERLYGWTAQQAVGSHTGMLVPPERQDEDRTAVAHVLRGEPQESLRTERLRKDGTRVWVSLTLSPLREAGVVTGLSVIGRDISHRMDQERLLAEARDQAVAAARAKSDFLATMSHEIRTPMNGVIGLTGLLLETGLDATQRRYTEGVRGAGEALLTIIDDILDFSKLESGRVELEDVAFDPRALVEEIGVLLAPAAAGKGLELLAYGDPALPAALRGDPGRLRQILVNLAGNALKFTATGEVVLAARVVTASGPALAGRQVMLELRVTDTGAGIAPEDQERLFEPFAQADASTTRRFGGTGLGLAICRHLVEAMGGEIRLDSTVGLGSTFRVTVPLEVCADPITPPAPQALTGLRLLVVDDNATNRLVLSQQLASWHLDADVCEDADGAWLALHAAVSAGRPYDVVILDLAMPGTDGLELAHRMAAEPALGRVRTLLLSSVGSVPQHRLDEAGIGACIAKPVRASALHDALMRLLSRGHVPSPQTRAAVRSARDAPLRGRVLVVEDDGVNQQVAEGVLQSLGWQVEIAGNGRVALEALSASAYAVVLMDCHMPEMDGFEATAELRRREGAGPRTPVIAMTAGVLSDNREQCLLAGMDDFVAKPVSVAELSRVLDLWAPPAPSPATRVLDDGPLAALRALGPADGWGLLPALVSTFLAAVPERSAALRAACENGDQTAVGRGLHGLLGGAATLGLTALTGLCAELEARSRNGEVVGVADLEEVDQALAAGAAALLDLLGTRLAGPVPGPSAGSETETDESGETPTARVGTR